MKLSELLDKITIKVPETGVIVVIKRNLSWLELAEAMKEKDPEKMGISLACKMIDSWNIQNDDDTIMEITDENVKRLPANIMFPIIAEVSKLTDKGNEKKKF